MFNDFIDDARCPEFTVALWVLAGQVFFAKICGIFRAEIGSFFILMFDTARFHHSARSFVI
jgi:hypothetical protein